MLLSFGNSIYIYCSVSKTDFTSDVKSGHLTMQSVPTKLQLFSWLAYVIILL